MAAKKMKMDDGQVAMVLSTTDMPLIGQDLSLVSTTPRFDTRSTGDWFADSGATSHMSDQRDWLIDFEPVPEGSWTVNGIGVSSYPVQGFGNVNVWTMANNEKKVITLKKVLYVPGLGTNLLSIAAVTDLGWNVTFANTRFDIHCTRKWFDHDWRESWIVTLPAGHPSHHRRGSS
jgi:hypothetical protein